MRRLCFGIGMLVLGCGDDGTVEEASGAERVEDTTASASAGSAAPSTDDGCNDYAARVERRLATVPEGLDLPVPEAVSPPAAEGEPLEDVHPLVTIIAGEEVLLDGQPLRDEGLGARLARARQSWSILHPDRPYPAKVDLWVDGDRSLGAVQRALASIPDHRVRLLVTSPSTADIPDCPPRLGAVCDDEGGAAERAVRFADAMGNAMGTCEPLVRTFGALANAPATEKGELFQAAAPDDLRACDCAVDREAFEYLAVRILAGTGPRVTALTLPDLDSLPPEQTVAEWVRSR